MQNGDREQGTGDPGFAGQRLDKWLWFARIVKSRSQAAALVTAGKVRINRVRVTKAAQAVRRGNVLTIALREKVLVLRIVQPGTRRGPPQEARALYEDLVAAGADAACRSVMQGAPERRQIDRSRGGA